LVEVEDEVVLSLDDWTESVLGVLKKPVPVYLLLKRLDVEV
jgi:hypothetical protein